MVHFGTVQYVHFTSETPSGEKSRNFEGQVVPVTIDEIG